MSGPERNRRVSTEDIARGLKAANGDVKVAALALGMNERALKARIDLNPQLRALWKDPDSAPKPVGAEEEAVGRSARTAGLAKDGDDKDGKPDMLAAIISKEDQALLRRGLGAAGIQQSTIDRLATLQGMELSGGKFLITSVDLAHRMMVMNSVSLFEESENIRTKYLHNETIDREERLEWHKIYNQITEILGRFADRTMAATSAMAMMLAGGKKEKANAKRHFKPLRDAPEASKPKRAGDPPNAVPPQPVDDIEPDDGTLDI